MLEPGHDQAAGLLAWDLRPPSRVLAVIAENRGQASLELLWRLRQGCEALGLSAGVVEGAPGQWGDGPEVGGVWLWHVPVDLAVGWWPAEGGRPLVALSAEPAALVAAYRALKALRQAGLEPVVVALRDEPSGMRLRSDAAPTGGHPAAPIDAALSALRRTCQTHLAWEPTVWMLGYHERGFAESDIEGSAVLCKVLDAAWLLDAPAVERGDWQPC